MHADDDFTQEPSKEGEPIERERGFLIQGAARRDVGDSSEGHDIDLGEQTDPELWGKQRALIEEDEVEGLKLDGFDEDLVPRILDAMGDDAAEALQDFPGGTSATGSTNQPNHGGFPEKK